MGRFEGNTRLADIFGFSRASVDAEIPHAYLPLTTAVAAPAADSASSAVWTDAPELRFGVEQPPSSMRDGQRAAKPSLAAATRMTRGLLPVQRLYVQCEPQCDV